MSLAAARKNDRTVCAAHVSGAIDEVTSREVETHGVPQARAGDRCLCLGGAADLIVTGSANVLVNGVPAARSADRTLHGGVIFGGASEVFIGGPRTGITIGDADLSKTRAACAAAAAGRAGGRRDQSASNCGLESCRTIINQANGTAIREDALMDQAYAERNATPDEVKGSLRKEWGSTSAEHRERILARYGIPSQRREPDMKEIAVALSEGRGVMTAHNKGQFDLGPGEPNSLSHVVVVTAVSFDENGKMVSVSVVDSSSTRCARVVSVGNFTGSFQRNRDDGSIVPMQVTDRRIW